MNVDSRLDEGGRLSDLLVAVGRDRDRDAFRRLFEFFAPRLRAFIGRREADQASVEDTVQETFVNIWRKAHLYDPAKASAATWIYAIARNARIDMLRKGARPMFDYEDPALAPEATPTPYQELTLADETVRLEKAMAALPPEQREVLRLAFMADMPHAEVAARLNLPLGTVKSRIRLALRRIRMEFGEEQ